MNVTVLAHAGGWDEAFFVGVPIGIFAILLAIANKRAAGMEEEAEQEPDGDP